MNQAPNVIRTLRALVPQRPLTYLEAQRIAELQANRLRELLGISEPMFPEEAITHLPRVQVIRTAKLPASGTKWRKGRWLVGIKSNEPKGRMRFSLAHEFKHILDHPHRKWLYQDDLSMSGHERAEWIAEFFGGCLLMPKRHVKRLFGERRSMTDMARIFGVTPRAMHVRLLQLGLVEPAPRCGWLDENGYRREIPASVEVAA